MVDSLHPAHNFEEIERGFKASCVSIPHPGSIWEVMWLPRIIVF